MNSTEILFGRMTHGTFEVCGDSKPMVIIHTIDERVSMNPDHADDYMVNNCHDSYLIPNQFTGEIVYTK